MPAQPAWFQRLDEILADLRSMTSTRLDRQAVEKLFGVGQRRARQLMAGLDGIRAGNAADRSPPQPSLYMRAPPADGTLEDRLRDGPLAPVQAASVVARLADPLAPCTRRNACTGPSSPAFVRLQDVAGRGSRDRQSHRAVQLHAVDLEEQLRTCSGLSVGASSSMSDRTPTRQDGTTYTEFYVAGVPQ